MKRFFGRPNHRSVLSLIFFLLASATLLPGPHWPVIDVLCVVLEVALFPVFAITQLIASVLFGLRSILMSKPPTLLEDLLAMFVLLAVSSYASGYGLIWLVRQMDFPDLFRRTPKRIDESGLSFLPPPRAALPTGGIQSNDNA